MQPNLLKLGTRASALARTQSQWIATQLEQRWSQEGLKVELVFIKTTGDIQREAPLGSLGGKGVFTREIETALLEGQIDFAVHSLKDLPTSLPEGLMLGAVPEREDARDALVGPAPIQALVAGLAVGTGSNRRQQQLQRLRPDLSFNDIRGNVPTRIEKWRSQQYSGGVVLAMAGLKRLGALSGAAENEIHPLSLEECVPAPCQGILGIECRQGDERTLQLLSRLNDVQASVQAEAERSFLRALGGGCNLPAGAFAQVDGDQIHLIGFLADDRSHLNLHLDGPCGQAASLGVELAQRLTKGLVTA
jgi:hydroxymethylbilane synthase